MLNTLKSRDAAMPFIMLTVLIDMVAIGIVIPVLPVLVGSFSSSQAEQAYWYGVVAFAFGVSNFLASPVLGALSDRYGRRPVLLLGFLGLGISFFGTALTTTLWGLIAVRAAGGAMQANAAIANAETSARVIAMAAALPEICRGRSFSPAGPADRLVRKDLLKPPPMSKRALVGFC